MHRDLAGKGARGIRVALGLDGDEHAHLAEIVGHGVVDIGRDAPLSDRKLRRAAEVHVLADRADRVLDRVGADALGRTGIARLGDRLGRSVGRQRDLGDVAHHLLEGVVAGHEVGLGIDLDHDRARASAATPIRPSAAVRPAFLSAFAMPFLRSQSTASSRLPLVSASAALQSIMPAPVMSRSCLTCAAEMLIFVSFLHFLKRRGAP
jgi:hypothetical protein